MPSLSALLTEQNHVPTILIAATIITLFVYTLYSKLLPKPIPGIPFDKNATKTILGDVLTLQDDPDGLALWCGKHLDRLGTPLCQVFMGPLAKPMVLVADIGDARDIVFGTSAFDRSDYIVDRFPLFRGFHFRMKTGDDWRLSRGWMKDLMTAQFLNSVGVSSVYDSVKKLVNLWELENRVADGRPFSMVADLRSLALDVISAFYLGGDFQDSTLGRQIDFVGKLSSDKLVVGTHNEVTFPRAPVHEFTQGMIVVGDRLAAIYDAVNTKLPPGLVSRWFRYIAPSFGKFFAAKDTFIGERLNRAFARSRRGEAARSGIDHMVFREEKAAAKADRMPLLGNLKQVMTDEVYGNLIAGQHTTSAALVWILKFVSEHPAVQPKLHEELQTVLAAAAHDNRFPTGAELAAAKLPYLEAVIEETMRLRASFLMPRDAVRDTDLMGYRIPKGTIVVLVSQGHHFDLSSSNSSNTKKRRQYPGAANASKDLDEFDPERWLARNDATGEVVFDGSSYPQMAFGVGLRACWGRKLAQMEMKMMLAMVAWKFELLPMMDADLASHEATYDISYRAKKGFLRLRSRGQFSAA
ncbi:cytochrome P450 [Apodospora peruviana]|uniref:Cytochrome P450 n=1 Tax=Apodospora peruviana TaxID=516989 RepID=A0AAE0HT42_9PEZI|nr:cytochrome P450 [Apodospora peruviana]